LIFRRIEALAMLNVLSGSDSRAVSAQLHSIYTVNVRTRSFAVIMPLVKFPELERYGANGKPKAKTASPMRAARLKGGFDTSSANSPRFASVMLARSNARSLVESVATMRAATAASPILMT
jgi:hypothetical protein